MSADGSKLYVGSQIGTDTGSVSVVDTASRTMTAKFVTGSNRLTDMVLSPDGTRLYTGHLGGQLKAIDTATNTVVSSVASGSSVYGVALSQDGTRIYTADGVSSVVRVVNAATMAPIRCVR